VGVARVKLNYGHVMTDVDLDSVDRSDPACLGIRWSAKLMLAIADEKERWSLLYIILMMVMIQAMPGLDKGKCMYLYLSWRYRAQRAVTRCSQASTGVATFWSARMTPTLCTYSSPDEAILHVDVYHSLKAIAARSTPRSPTTLLHVCHRRAGAPLPHRRYL
jgi:hypothetical protein